MMHEHCKLHKLLLKCTRILFCGLGQIHFSFMGYKYSQKQPTDTDKVFLNYSGTLLI